MFKHFLKPARVSAVFLLSCLAASIACASEKTSYPDAAASDPAKMGWMVGAPPPPDRIVRFADGSYFQFPAMRWSVSNFRQLMPTTNVSRGLGAPVPLARALRAAVEPDPRVDSVPSTKGAL